MDLYILIRICLGLFFMASIACTTGNRVVIESFPSGAKVYAKPLGHETSKLLGETPLVIQTTDMEYEYFGSGPIYVEVEKENYIKEKVFITELSRVDTLLRFTLTPEQDRKNGQQVDYLVEEILDIKKLVKQQRFDTAMDKLKDLEKVAPDVSIVYELQGAVFVIQKKMGDALTAYKLAVKYNPQNLEANKMRRFLESTYFGGRDQ